MESEIKLMNPTIDRVTIHLSRKEASIIRNLAGSVSGSTTHVRAVTDKLWVLLDNAERDHGEEHDNGVLRNAEYFKGYLETLP